MEKMLVNKIRNTAVIVWYGVKFTQHKSAMLSEKKKGGGVLSQTTNFRLFGTGCLQITLSNFLKMAESSPNRLKTLWEKEKLLVTSNFSFSLSVLKRLVLQTSKNQGLFRKELMHL